MQRVKPYIGWIIGYIVLMIAVAWGFQRAYSWGTVEFDSTTERENWKDWRAAVAKQNKEGGPVERRMPKSKEPPFLVLMRDHYTTCLIGALLFVTAIYVALVFMVHGVIKGQPFEVEEDT